MKLHWWLRLRWYEWRNAWRVSRGRRSAEIVSWMLPGVLLPLALRIASANKAATAQDWVLSFDIPLALLLTVVVTVQATPATVRVPGQSEDAWLLPLTSCRAIALFQWLRDKWRAGRWPIRFAIAGCLLGIGADHSALTEWLLIAVLAFAAGVILARLHAPSTPRGARMWSGAARGKGLAALSAVPLRAAWQQLDLRRLLFLCIPILLAAPMGTPVYQIALGVAAWIPLVYLAASCREAGNAVASMRAWLPLPRWRLHWWVWRHVAVLLVATATVAWAVWHFILPTTMRSKV